MHCELGVHGLSVGFIAKWQRIEEGETSIVTANL